MDALKLASSLKLKDWCLAAGFVRNLIWDNVHGYKCATVLNDIDLIYFDMENCSVRKDQEMENTLRGKSCYPWSVKNQAYMHVRNNDRPYLSSADAMTYWVEIQTAIGAKLDDDNNIEIIAPFGVDIFFDNFVNLNRKRPKPDLFTKRVKEKKWLEHWPNLTVIY